MLSGGLPTEPGIYRLVLFLPHTYSVRIKTLGCVRFPPGYYVYTGSALSGLAKRLRRYLRPDRRIHWHIDHLLAAAEIKEIQVLLTGEKLPKNQEESIGPQNPSERCECFWANQVLSKPNAVVVAPRFGASDCRCTSHLAFFGAEVPVLADGWVKIQLRQCV
jgi:Uri superfamily endonuclease